MTNNQMRTPEASVTPQVLGAQTLREEGFRVDFNNGHTAWLPMTEWSSVEGNLDSNERMTRLYSVAGE